jgi:hypothetical protein
VHAICPTDTVHFTIAEALIGKQALPKLGDPDYMVVQHSKLVMGLSYEEVVQNLPLSAKDTPQLTPYIEVVKDAKFEMKPLLKGEL